MGFAYMTAAAKDAFDEQIGRFCDPEAFLKPVVFEVFTDAEDEKTALKNMRAFHRPIR